MTTATPNTITRSDNLDDSSAELILTDAPVERTFISQFDVQFDEHDDSSIKILASFNKGYILRIKEGREEGVTDKLKRRQGLIFLQEYSKEHFDFNIEMTFKKTSNVVFLGVVVTRRTTRKAVGFGDMTIYYFQGINWKTESVKSLDTERNTAMPYKFVFPIHDIEKYVDDRNVFMEISIGFKTKAVPGNPKKYCGLENVGNTCYMNSFLQSLFFLKPFRKALFELNAEGNAFMLAFQQTFASMMAYDSSVISPIAIIEASSWSREFLFSQQDIHEFKLRVFEEIQKLNKKILDMFAVESVSTVSCKQVDYSNKTNAVNYQIQLNLTGVKKKKITNITQALDYQCHEQQLQAKIDTQKFGLQTAFKSIKFTKLPPVLFLNLKRYLYVEQDMQKLTSLFQFQKALDLTSLVNNGVNYKYNLYAVLVHRGRSANSGHYYTFINTSTDVGQYDWYKFNDSIVTQAEQNDAIKENYGGLEKTYRFSRERQCFVDEKLPKLATAYILVYIRTEDFNNMQLTVCSIPNWIVAEQAKKAAEVPLEADWVNVILVDDMMEKAADVFKPPLSLVSKKIQFNLRQPIQAHYTNIKGMFDNAEGTLWRVSMTFRTVMNLQRKFDNTSLTSKAMLYGDNPNSPKDDFYILFVPNKHFIADSSSSISLLEASNKLALVFIYCAWEQQEKYKRKLESVTVLNIRDKVPLQNIMDSQHAYKELQRNDKIFTVQDIIFSRKNMYCEVIRSFMKVDHLKSSEDIRLDHFR